MHYRLKITAVLVTVFLITACTGATHQDTTKNIAKPEKNNEQTNADDRGFDPCLINANLAACVDNEKSN